MYTLFFSGIDADLLSEGWIKGITTNVRATKGYFRTNFGRNLGVNPIQILGVSRSNSNLLIFGTRFGHST